MIYSGKFNTTVLCILFILFENLDAFGQKKNILEKKQSVEYAAELLNPFNFSLDHRVVAIRQSLSYRVKTSSSTEVGLRLMKSDYKSIKYYWDISVKNKATGADTFFKVDILRGRTQTKSFEFGFRKYRTKKGSLVPFGMFYEIIGGLNYYTFTEKEHWGNKTFNLTPNEIVYIPERKITTYSIGIKFGRQWLFENNFILSSGVSYKYNFLQNKIRETTESTLYPLSEMFKKDVVQRDIISGFVAVGYVF